MKKVYNVLVCISIFFAWLSCYCRMFISEFVRLQGNNVFVALFFILGIVVSSIMTFLLHHLFHRFRKQL